jgi:hypothetical protein
MCIAWSSSLIPDGLKSAICAAIWPEPRLILLRNHLHIVLQSHICHVSSRHLEEESWYKLISQIVRCTSNRIDLSMYYFKEEKIYFHVISRNRIAFCFGALLFVSSFTDISRDMFSRLTKPASMLHSKINTTMEQVEAAIDQFSYRKCEPMDMRKNQKCTMVKESYYTHC